MLDHRHRRWPSIEPALSQCLVSAAMRDDPLIARVLNSPESVVVGRLFGPHVVHGHGEGHQEYHAARTPYGDIEHVRGRRDVTTLVDVSCNKRVNPLPAVSSYFNFHPLEVVCRCRDPQLQVGEN